MQPETKFKERVLERLRLLPKSWWVKIQMLALLGIPDILGVINGRFVALELKASKELRPDPLQQRNLNLIERAGGFASCVHPENWDLVFSQIRDL